MLNKQQFVVKVVDNLGVSKNEALRILGIISDVVQDACINYGGIQITGLFTLEKKLRKGRTYKNPATGEIGKTEDSYVLAIKTGKSLKEKLNG